MCFFQIFFNWKLTVESSSSHYFSIVPAPLACQPTHMCTQPPLITGNIPAYTHQLYTHSFVRRDFPAFFLLTSWYRPHLSKILPLPTSCQSPDLRYFSLHFPDWSPFCIVPALRSLWNRLCAVIFLVPNQLPSFLTHIHTHTLLNNPLCKEHLQIAACNKTAGGHSRWSPNVRSLMCQYYRRLIYSYTLNTATH